MSCAGQPDGPRRPAQVHRPERAVAGFAGRLRAERALGRIAPDADTDASASLLVGACFQEAYLRYYAHGVDAPAAPRAFAEGLARAVVRPLS